MTPKSSGDPNSKPNPPASVKNEEDGPKPIVQSTPEKLGGTTVQVLILSVALAVHALPQLLILVVPAGQMASTRPLPFCPVKFSRYCADKPAQQHNAYIKVKRNRVLIMMQIVVEQMVEPVRRIRAI